MQQLFHTDTLEKEKHLSGWSHAIDSLLGLRIEPANDPQHTSGGVWATDTGSLRVLKTDLPFAHSVRSSRARRELLILLQTGGQCRLEQNGSDSIYCNGDIAILDGSAELDGSMSGRGGGTWLSVPLDGRNAELAGPLNAAGLRIDAQSPTGAVASAFLNTFAQQAAHLRPEHAARLFNVLVDLLNTAVLECSGRLVDGNRSRAYLRRHIRLYIENHLQEQALSAATIAEDVGVSTRYLNKIFADQPLTISQLIRERRLVFCRRDLRDPDLVHRSVTEIAFSWGFNSAAHFSRIYKDRFGLTPTEQRHATCA